jgi:hypothetical protein
VWPLTPVAAEASLNPYGALRGFSSSQSAPANAAKGMFVNAPAAQVSCVQASSSSHCAESVQSSGMVVVVGVVVLVGIVVVVVVVMPPAPPEYV